MLLIALLLYLSNKSFYSEVEYNFDMLKIQNLSVPLFKNGIFDNPWPQWRKPSISNLVYWGMFEKDKTNLPSIQELNRNLPVHQITKEEIEKFCSEDTTDKFKVIWIGHSTSLINFENTIIITDPVFSDRASPFSFAGPKRFRPVPITIDKIPRIDVVVISHNHYDHLDIQSVLNLNKKFGTSQENGLNWFMGAGTASWFRSNGINNNLHELTWWGSKKFKNIEFVFTPAQHWSGRGAFDRNKALWGGWAMLGLKKKVYFAGDSGYCPGFKEIGDKLGPFDFSFIPIGAYEPRWFMSPQHIDPQDAVKVHQDVKSNKSFAIHWGTFALANEFYLSPKNELNQELNSLSLNTDEFVTLQHGNIYDF